MACNCLSRHLEEQILQLDMKRDALPRWRWLRRRTLWERTCVLFHILQAAYAAERAR